MTEKIKEMEMLDPELIRLQKLLEDVDIDLPDKVEINIIAAQRYQVVRQYKLLLSQLTGIRKHRKLVEIGGDDRYKKQIDEQINDFSRNCNMLKMQVASIDEDYPTAKEIMEKNLQNYDAK